MLIKKIVFFTFIIIAIVIINDLAHSIYNLWQKNKLMDQSRQSLRMEQRKNEELTRKLKTVASSQFIEEEARNKLFLVKPGEGIVVIAPTAYLQASMPEGAKHKDMRPNWQQWWELFF